MRLQEEWRASEREGCRGSSRARGRTAVGPAHLLHEPLDGQVLAAVVAAHPTRPPEAIHGLEERGADRRRLVVRRGAQERDEATLAVDAAVDDESPADELVVTCRRDVSKKACRASGEEKVERTPSMCQSEFGKATRYFLLRTASSQLLVRPTRSTCCSAARS